MRNPLVVEPPHGAHHNHACGQGAPAQYRPAQPTGDGPGRLRLGAQGGLRSCERNHVAAFAAAREMLQNLGALALRERLLHKSRQQVRIGMLPSLAGLPSLAHDFGKLFHHSLLTFLRDSYIILSHFPGPSVPVVAYAGPSGPVAYAGPSGPVAYAAPSGPVAYAAPSGPVAYAAPSGPVAGRA